MQLVLHAENRLNHQANFYVILKWLPKSQLSRRKKNLFFLQGDILDIDGKYYYLRSDNKYPIPDLNIFRRNTGIKTAPIKVSRGIVERIRVGEIWKGPVVLDWSGQVRRNNKNGGKKLLYGAGLFTETPAILMPDDISLDRVFGSIRAETKKKKFEEQDNLYLTYDPKKSWFGYRRVDTMRDPRESVKLFSDQVKKFKEDFPLDKFIPVVHSLGGPITLNALFEHLDAIDTFVSLDSPLKGIPHNLPKNILAKIASVFGEKVVNYLLNIWEDQSYQKKLKDMVLEMKKRGIRVYTFASKDDLIVPWQSAILEGATNEINGRKIELSFPMGSSSLTELGHGSVLWHPTILKYVSEIIGENYAVN